MTVDRPMPFHREIRADEIDSDESIRRLAVSLWTQATTALRRPRSQPGSLSETNPPPACACAVMTPEAPRLEP